MKDIEEIAYDVLREMYSEAEPPLDFDDALENPDEMGEQWYENHYLPADRQEEIVDKYADKHDLTNSEHVSLTWTAILDLGPTSSQEVANEN